MDTRKTSSFLMFPDGKPLETPSGFDDLTRKLEKVQLDSAAAANSSRQSPNLSYVTGAPNKLGFRTRRPVVVGETKLPRTTTDGKATDPVTFLPDLPELSTLQARQTRLARLTREAKAREEAERTYVSLGGTLIDSEGRRDTQRTALIKEELRKEEEAKRLERERRERNQAAFEARECFEARWGELSKADLTEDNELNYEDVPWPVFGGCLCHPGPDDLEDELRATPEQLKGEQSSDNAMDVDPSPTPLQTTTRIPSPYLTARAIDAFLFHPARPDLKTPRAKVLKNTLLLFHADKFTAKILSRVCEADRERVEIDAEKVTQILTAGKDDLGKRQ